MSLASKRKTNTTKTFKRLMAVFSDGTATQQEQVAPLVQRAAFLLTAAAELEETMQENGFTATYDNGGGQRGSMVSAEMKSYNICISQINALYKTLKTFAVSEEQEDDALAVFLKKK